MASVTFLDCMIAGVTLFWMWIWVLAFPLEISFFLLADITLLLVLWRILKK